MDKGNWERVELPPLSLKDTPQERIDDLVRAIITLAFADYFGANDYRRNKAELWFESESYGWLTPFDLKSFVKKLEALGAAENKKDARGGYGKYGKYQNRFFIANRDVKAALRRKRLRAKDLAEMVGIPPKEMYALLSEEQSEDVKEEWIRLIEMVIVPETIDARYRKNFERENDDL